MKKALTIAALISLALLFSSNSVWAAAQSGIASAPGPEDMFLFGIGLIGLTVIGRFKFKK
jgi:hypothetical protein